MAGMESPSFLAVQANAEPITSQTVFCGLSALRLCVGLFDNGNVQLFHVDERFLPALGTEQGEVGQEGIFSYAAAGLASAEGAVNPFRFRRRIA
jgi:hypothetical protein